MKKIAAGIVLMVAAVIAVVALYLMFSGPRMRVQPKIVSQQVRMPAMPQGIVPVSFESSPIPSPQAAAQLRNPLPDTDHTRQTGRVYYGYYCAFCHGQTGRGDGPVGDSYTPVPTDLALPRVQTLSDGALYRAMLTGIGHEPVLDYVIEPKARWHIVSYMRYLQSERAGQSSPAATQ
jgi:mono/diheme cytochrome c family protein